MHPEGRGFDSLRLHKVYMVEVIYKHWKKDKTLSVKGVILDNVRPESERIVVKTEDGKYEDVLKSTIIEIKTDGE